MVCRYISIFILLMAVMVTQTTPVIPHAWKLEASHLVPVLLPLDAVPLNSPVEADMNLDGVLESLLLDRGHLSIQSATATIWQSDASWRVVQAAISDLNQDNIPEAALLVWRTFKPWPVDEFLPNGGRIDTFQDGKGNSCHIILVGWLRDELGEIWAGSALADPLTTFATVDLNGDGNQELVTLEGQYAAKGSTPAQDLKVWEWNGFGFSVVSSIKGMFSDLVLVRGDQGQILILTP